jgi:hypothetical protein
MKTPLIVSCLFGTGPFNIYPPPDAALYRCVFFTNRKEIAERAESLGWIPCLAPFPEDADPVTTALQSKSVKYLNFLRDPFYEHMAFDATDGVIYFDHKFKVTGAHVERFAGRADDFAVVLRTTPRPKWSIWTEVAEAESQERYARHMKSTKAYIHQLIDNGYSAETRICNTGLIYYSKPASAYPLAQRVLDSCLLLRQPECQIFWALHAQPYSGLVRMIDWTDAAVADIEWRDPIEYASKPKQQDSLFACAKRSLKRLMAQQR